MAATLHRTHSTRNRSSVSYRWPTSVSRWPTGKWNNNTGTIYLCRQNIKGGLEHLKILLSVYFLSHGSHTALHYNLPMTLNCYHSNNQVYTLLHIFLRNTYLCYFNNVYTSIFEIFAIFWSLFINRIAMFKNTFWQNMSRDMQWLTMVPCTELRGAPASPIKVIWNSDTGNFVELWYEEIERK